MKILNCPSCNVKVASLGDIFLNPFFWILRKRKHSTCGSQLEINLYVYLEFLGILLMSLIVIDYFVDLFKLSAFSKKMISVHVFEEQNYFLNVVLSVVKFLVSLILAYLPAFFLERRLFKIQSMD